MRWGLTAVAIISMIASCSFKHVHPIPNTPDMDPKKRKAAIVACRKAPATDVAVTIASLAVMSLTIIYFSTGDRGGLSNVDTSVLTGAAGVSSGFLGLFYGLSTAHGYHHRDQFCPDSESSNFPSKTESNQP